MILQAPQKHFGQLPLAVVSLTLWWWAGFLNNQQSFLVECFQQYGYPTMDGLEWKTLLKFMIWGYPYFWKQPVGGFCPNNINQIASFTQVDFFSLDFLKVFGKSSKHIPANLVFFMVIYHGRIRTHPPTKNTQKFHQKNLWNHKLDLVSQARFSTNHVSTVFLVQLQFASFTQCGCFFTISIPLRLREAFTNPQNFLCSHGERGGGWVGFTAWMSRVPEVRINGERINGLVITYLLMGYILRL